MLGYDVNMRSVQELAQEAESRLKQNSQAPLVCACLNPHSIVVSRSLQEFKKALGSADHLIADGSGIILGSKILRRKTPPHITGFDYFSALMECLESAVKTPRVCFLGSTEATLSAIQNRLKSDFPKISVKTISPPFGDWDASVDRALCSAVNDFAPQILWVGMTAPKQELWVARNKSALDVTVIGSIGAVFDFYAGSVPRAPRWMLRLNMEWIDRLRRNPKKMWRRNFISTPVFLWSIMCERLSYSRQN
ncbi:MAG: WecB/TagA/CpsF family glycosyltransferase [Pseudomonadota bacterium]